MTVKISIAGVGGVLSYLFGGFDNLMMTLLILMTIDYISGVLKAIYNRKINSQIGFRGIIKKVMILLLVVLASTLQTVLLSTVPIRDVVIMFYIANEGISIIENMGSVIPIPENIKAFFEQLNKKKDK